MGQLSWHTTETVLNVTFLGYTQTACDWEG